MQIKLSVCVPAYNRQEVLRPLLDSIFAQDYDSFEVVICEDGSPQRAMIKAIAGEYELSHPGRIKYFENPENLGYDGNIRNLIEKASGEYCFFMGNDDLMCPGALSTVASALERHKNVGVILRSYAAFEGSPENIRETYRYFEKETLFRPGPETVATFYKRCVVIPGLVLHRAESLKYSTPRYDGTLLYQLYLVANILNDMSGVSLPQILVLYRRGGVPDFGNSEREKGKFTPTEQTPESSLHFMEGMLRIAREVGEVRKAAIYEPILADLGNYSYPILEQQARQKLSVFLRYYLGLAKLGFGKSKMFHFYFLALFFFGPRISKNVINLIKNYLGHTPAIGKIAKGETF